MLYTKFTPFTNRTDVFVILQYNWLLYTIPHKILFRFGITRFSLFFLWIGRFLSFQELDLKTQEILIENIV